jgi:hypothetical protein
VQPSQASGSAIERPMLRVAPVTSARLPFSSKSTTSLQPAEADGLNDVGGI